MAPRNWPRTYRVVGPRDAIFRNFFTLPLVFLALVPVEAPREREREMIRQPRLPSNSILEEKTQHTRGCIVRR